MTLSPIRHIIWDWNGTLFDDADLTQSITLHQLAQVGISGVTREDIQRAFTHPVRKIYETLGADFNKYPFEHLALNWFTEYSHQISSCSLRAEAKRVLASISKRNIGQSVLSAVKHNLLVQTIEAHGLSGFFEQVSGLSDHLAVSKIHNAKEMLRKLKLSAQEILVVGDTTHDLEAAQEMGAHIVLIPSGYQHVDILRESGAPLIPCLSQLEEHLLSIRASA